MARSRIDNTAIGDAARWGIELEPEDLGIDADTGVWVENVAAAEAFLSVSTQWRVVEGLESGARAIGLDYAGCEAGLRLSGTSLTAELWGEVQLIEIGALEEMNGAGT